MKSKFKLLISSLLIISLVLSNSIVLAMSNIDLTSPEAINKQLETNISLIEQDLEKQGTSVEAVLEDLISVFEQKKQGTTDSEEIAKLQRLIDTANDLLRDYTNYKSGVTTKSFHPIYSPAIAAVVAWFGSQGYSLSAELLIHAEDNSVLWSTYYPSFGSIANYSPVT